jgi:uncharacterized membrane protein
MTLVSPATFTNSEIKVQGKINRIESIDLLRGLVMIVMALDHVRGYFHFDTFLFSPTDIEHTTFPMFGTRLVTHLCAPTFIFLSGASAYFTAKRKSLRETSFFLITRGAWLVVLQVTIVQFMWNFDPAFHFISSNIISTIGFCMIALAFIIRLKYKVILIFGLVVVIGHNFLDGISFEPNSYQDIVWAFLHAPNQYIINDNQIIQFKYPIIPWVGVMALGYCLGHLYDQSFSTERRKKILLQIGLSCLTVFVILRWTNYYGDPLPWAHHLEFAKTFFSFLNVQKYPPSLLFLCLTLGVALVLLAMFENVNSTRLGPVILFGKVALFYYVVHVFVIHALAMMSVIWMGYPWQTMVYIGSHNVISPILKGKYGFTLGQTYLIWIAIVISLYPICAAWNRFKSRKKQKWWVSYV